MKKAMIVMMTAAVIALTLASCGMGFPGFPSYGSDDDITIDVPDLIPPYTDDDITAEDSAFADLVGKTMTRTDGDYSLVLGPGYERVRISEGLSATFLVISQADGDEETTIKVTENNKAASVGSDTAYVFTVNDDDTLIVSDADTGLENIYGEAE